MGFNSDDFRDDRDNHPGNENEAKPNGYRVEDDSNLTEENLERDLYGKSESNMQPVKEGQPMGGQNFGKNSNTPAGDDKNNPSQNAGYGNAYFARTEPSEEHPEDTNFKDPQQDGAPDYDKAQPPPTMSNGTPKPEVSERGNGENDRPHKDGSYQEGTADNEKAPNIPGPDELPDQQKVGEDEDDYPDEGHIET